MTGTCSAKVRLARKQNVTIRKHALTQTPHAPPVAEKERNRCAGALIRQLRASIDREAGGDGNALHPAVCFCLNNAAAP